MRIIKPKISFWIKNWTLKVDLLKNPKLNRQLKTHHIKQDVDFKVNPKIEGRKISR